MINRTPLIHDRLEDIRDFPLDDSDVLVGGFPKSGTNWMQVIIQNLWDGWGTCAITERGNVPNLSGPNGLSGGYAGYDYCIAAESPRLMKTHLHRDLMPTRWPEHGKVVYITRNPKDVCISLWHEMRNSNRVPDDFDAYFDRFLAGDVLPYDPYLSNVRSWNGTEHDNLLKINYEAARRDPRSAIDAIVAFVGRPVTEDVVVDVLRRTSFESMRNDPQLRAQLNHTRALDTEKPFIRKGAVGDWKTILSPQQNERIEREIVKPLEDAGVFLSYE